MEKISSHIELQIGLTDYCNFNCIMCMQSAHNGIYGNSEIKASILHEGNKGFMSRDVFKKIIDDVSNCSVKLKTVAFHWLGESMIHPDFFEFVDYACRKNEKNEFTEYFILFTNCYYLNEKNADKLIEIIKKNNFILVFSLDSIDEKTYEIIHRNKYFFKIYENVKKFTENTQKIYNIFRVYRFLVMEENYCEAKKFFEFWAKFVGNDFQLTFNEEKNFDPGFSNNIINFKRVYAYDVKKSEELFSKTVAGLVDSAEKKFNSFESFNFFDKLEKRPICAAPFRTPVFNWDGTLTVCCPDDRMELAVGNIKSESFENLWFGGKICQLRKSHIEGKLSAYKRCMRCSNYAGKPLLKEEIELLFNKCCDKMPKKNKIDK